VSEIAYTCGFNKLSNFNCPFREIHRMTPPEYCLRQIG
jgi:AraC-like DNA-binding protein